MSSKRPRRQSAIIVVVEVAQVMDGADSAYVMYLSKPGHSLVIEKRWETPHGYLDHGQAVDMGGTIAAAVHDSLITWGGVQGVLPTV